MLTDFHCHILPGLDDGSAGLEESLQMLKKEAEQGVQTVVATPHFYARHDMPDVFLRRRQQAMEQLNRAAEGQPLPKIVLGAEVHYFPGMSDSDILPQLTIGKKPYILVEMPMPPWSEKVYTELAAIYEKQRLIPIIAHIDRYIAPLQTYRIPQRLEQLPVLVQANAEFFTQKATSALAFRLLRADRIHLLGTDGHNMTDRSPDMAAAVENIRKKLGAEALERIVQYEKQVLGE